MVIIFVAVNAAVVVVLSRKDAGKKQQVKRSALLLQKAQGATLDAGERNWKDGRVREKELVEGKGERERERESERRIVVPCRFCVLLLLLVMVRSSVRVNG